MSDSEVYEDTPVVEYLKSIASNDALVKPSPLRLGTPPFEDTSMISIPKQISESFYRYWRQSLFHDTFSVSLPIMEEMAFEEKFKYLIVTSHLLNDTLSTQPKQKTSHQAPPPFQTPAAHTRSAAIGTMVTLAGLLAAVGLERYTPFQLQHNEHHHHHHQPQQQQQQQQQQYEDDSPTTLSTLKGITPTVTMMLASGISLFFIYRHLRRSSIRKLYQCALTQLQDVLEQSQLLDSKVHRALSIIQETESVSQGYQLSVPLSPTITTTTTATTPDSEQTIKSTQRCSGLRSQLSRLLRRAFIVYEEAIIDLSDWVNKPTLARLFDMYNVQSVASLSSATTKLSSLAMENSENDNDSNSNRSSSMEEMDDSITLDYLKSLAHLMHMKRRECMLQFLALSVMTGDHDSVRKGYETGWKNINSVLLKVKNETTAFAKNVKESLDKQFAVLDRNETTFSTHAETQQFVYRLSLLNQHLRTTEARIYLCNDELQRRHRLLSSPMSSKATYHDKDQALALEQRTLRKEYMAMEKDIRQLVTEWEAGKQALDSLLAPTTTTTKIVSSKLDPLDIPPSPLPSPTMTPKTTNGPSFPLVVTSNESSERFHVPFTSKSSVYTSKGNNNNNNNSNNTLNGNKKARLERMDEMKRKWEQETKQTSSRMVHDIEK